MHLLHKSPLLLPIYRCPYVTSPGVTQHGLKPPCAFNPFWTFLLGMRWALWELGIDGRCGRPLGITPMGHLVHALLHRAYMCPFPFYTSHPPRIVLLDRCLPHFQEWLKSLVTWVKGPSCLWSICNCFFWGEMCILLGLVIHGHHGGKSGISPHGVTACSPMVLLCVLISLSDLLPTLKYYKTYLDSEGDHNNDWLLSL